MTTIHKCQCGHPACGQYMLSTQGGVGFSLEDARLYAASKELLAAANKAFDFLGGVDGAAEIRGELLNAILAATQPKEINP